MTITLPWRGTGSRRAVDEVARLRHQLAGAGIHIQGLRLQIADAEVARDRANAKAGCYDEAEDRATAAEQALAELKDELLELRAYRDNHQAITVPPMLRDIDPDDHPTEPGGINVRPLWEALREHGPGIPVLVPTAGASPAHIPAWKRPDDIAALPFLRLVQGRP